MKKKYFKPVLNLSKWSSEIILTESGLTSSRITEEAEGEKVSVSYRSFIINFE